MQYHYETKGTCSRAIDIDLDEATGTIRSVRFTGGCNGNTKGLTALVEGSPVSRPYSLMSSPAQARQGPYGLTIKAQGLLSRYLVEQAKVGDRFTLTGPEGDFTWQPLRDAPHLVALASGSGVAAFLSMARAVREGDLNLRMTLLYTCPWQDGFLHKKELDGLQESGVEVRYFCPDCPDGSLEPLNAAQVDRAAGQEPYSLFWCGSPEAMAGTRVRETIRLASNA